LLLARAVEVLVAGEASPIMLRAIVVRCP
jgi:hypothetical protein